MPTPFSRITPTAFPWFPYERFTFSLGLVSADNNKAWLSGHTGSQHDHAVGKMVITGTATEQVRISYAKIEAILAGCGMTFTNVKRVVEYLAEHSLQHYADAEAIRHEAFGEHRPAVNTVVVNHLLRTKAVMEVEVVASKDESPPIRISSSGRVSFADARAMEDVVYLSTVLPTDNNGNVMHSGDLVGQAHYVFEKLLRTLEACGLGAANVVKTLDYTTPATLKDYKATGRARKQFLTAPYPAAAGILMKRMIHPDITISLDVTASRHQPIAVNPGWERYAKLTYSPAVKAGKMLFMSGQAALDPATETAVHEGDVTAQAEYTYNNIVATLSAAGCGPEHLIKTIEYVTPQGLPEYRNVAGVRDRILRQPYPASTGIVCEALLRPEFLIEIDPMAVLPDDAVASTP